MDHLGLEESVERCGQGVVVAVAPRTDGGQRTSLGEPLRVSNGEEAPAAGCPRGTPAATLEASPNQPPDVVMVLVLVAVMIIMITSSSSATILTFGYPIDA